jgi:hypothetical protein
MCVRVCACGFFGVRMQRYGAEVGVAPGASTCLAATVTVAAVVTTVAPSPEVGLCVASALVCAGVVDRTARFVYVWLQAVALGALLGCVLRYPDFLCRGGVAVVFLFGFRRPCCLGNHCAALLCRPAVTQRSLRWGTGVPYLCLAVAACCCCVLAPRGAVTRNPLSLPGSPRGCPLWRSLGLGSWLCGPLIAAAAHTLWHAHRPAVDVLSLLVGVAVIAVCSLPSASADSAGAFAHAGGLVGGGPGPFGDTLYSSLGGDSGTRFPGPLGGPGAGVSWHAAALGGSGGGGGGGNGRDTPGVIAAGLEGPSVPPVPLAVAVVVLASGVLCFGHGVPLPAALWTVTTGVGHSVCAVALALCVVAVVGRVAGGVQRLDSVRIRCTTGSGPVAPAQGSSGSSGSGGGSSGGGGSSQRLSLARRCVLAGAKAALATGIAAGCGGGLTVCWLLARSEAWAGQRAPQGLTVLAAALTLRCLAAGVPCAAVALLRLLAPGMTLAPSRSLRMRRAAAALVEGPSVAAGSGSGGGGGGGGGDGGGGGAAAARVAVGVALLCGLAVQVACSLSVEAAGLLLAGVTALAAAAWRV